MNKSISNITKVLSPTNQAIRYTDNSIIKHNLSPKNRREEITDGILNKYNFKSNEQELNSNVLNTNSFSHKLSNNCSLNNLVFKYKNTPQLGAIITKNKNPREEQTNKINLNTNRNLNTANNNYL